MVQAKIARPKMIRKYTIRPSGMGSSNCESQARKQRSMLVTIAFLDVNITGAIVGFFVFRVLDVIKPPPAARLENLHGGPGIMFDDLMAGVYGHIVMRAGITLFPGVLA